MEKQTKSKETSSRALKRLEAHLKSPGSSGNRLDKTASNSHGNGPHSRSVEGNISRSSDREIQNRNDVVEPRRSVSSGREKRKRSHSSPGSASKSSLRESRSPSRSTGRRRSRNSRGKSSRRSRSSSEEPPAWARELLSQQQRNADELKTLRSQVAAKSNESTLTGTKVAEHEFRYAGNKKQYELNRSVIKNMDRALVSDDRNEAARDINQGKSLLLERNKHLLLADKYGWDTVECYTTEPLASDSEDEKRIKRALKESKSLRNERKTESAHARSKTFFRKSAKPISC